MSRIEIERKGEEKIQVSIFAGKPGIIIGRQGISCKIIMFTKATGWKCFREGKETVSCIYSINYSFALYFVYFNDLQFI
ncbi:MAG: hypothetical protein QM220_06570 [Atribacterota bacterium]|nr:hypothetical protein [Atribacterota bacterium]